MAYSRPFDPTTPLGNVLEADDIDLEFRQEKIDLKERMNELVVDYTTDPIVPQAKLLGNVVGKAITIDGHGFVGDINYAANTAYVEVNGATADIYASCILPAGVTVTKIVPTYDRLGSTNSVAFLESNAFGTITTRAAANMTTGSGIQTVPGAPVSHVVVTAWAYRFRITLGGGTPKVRFYQIRVEYNTPDCRNTV